jgi:hypothetical protein
MIFIPKVPNNFKIVLKKEYMGILNGNLQCEKADQNFILSIKIWTMIMCTQGLHIRILSCNLVVLSLMNMCHYCHHQCQQLFLYQLIMLWLRPMSENSIAWLSLNKMMCGEFALMDDLLCWMWPAKSTKDGDGWWSWALEEITLLSFTSFLSFLCFIVFRLWTLVCCFSWCANA